MADFNKSVWFPWQCIQPIRQNFFFILKQRLEALAVAKPDQRVEVDLELGGNLLKQLLSVLHVFGNRFLGVHLIQKKNWQITFVFDLDLVGNEEFHKGVK